MKEVKPDRFKRRPEDIAFEGDTIPDSPSEGMQRSDERPAVRTPSESTPASVYTVMIPGRRRKIRHAFDIYEDQLDALKKLQIASQDEPDSERAPTLGEMTRRALDAYISAQAKKTPTVRLIRQ